jgi:hypothetical protein
MHTAFKNKGQAHFPQKVLVSMLVYKIDFETIFIFILVVASSEQEEEGFEGQAF